MFLRSFIGNRDFFFVDLLSGTGVRGIRVALEVGGCGVLNDIDPRALYYIRKNIALNGLEARLEAYNNEANTLLNMLVFSGLQVDYIDVDPYGSPVPFLDSTFKPIGRESFIGITATDTAPLTCTYPHKALSRYWDHCVKVDFEKEYAARLLIANVTMRASALEVELTPLLTVVQEYFIRVFFRARRSASGAYKKINECIGYIWYCEKTLERGFIKTLEEARDVKCIDGSKPVLLGKTWTCEIGAQEAVLRMLNESSKTPWIQEKALKVLRTLEKEVVINTPYIRLDRLCSILKVNMPNIEKLLTNLNAAGVKCTRTHMDPRGIRVDSDYNTLISAILSALRT